MTSRQTFEQWVTLALQNHGGRANILQVSKYIWKNHEGELRNDDETFYKWQYIIRWAAKVLREKGIMKAATDSPKGIWELT